MDLKLQIKSKRSNGGGGDDTAIAKGSGASVDTSKKEPAKRAYQDGEDVTVVWAMSARRSLSSTAKMQTLRTQMDGMIPR